MAVTELVPAPAGLTNELLLEFFLVFSRFEYAMKAAGWTKPGAYTAEPDWPRLINEIQGQDPSVTRTLLLAGKYLLDLPPRKQVRSPDGSIGWSTVKCDDAGQRVSCLLRSVKRVRNNLFHGGKFELLTRPSDRNRQLVLGSLRVLEGLLKVPFCSRIRDKYYEYTEEPG